MDIDSNRLASIWLAFIARLRSLSFILRQTSSAGCPRELSMEGAVHSYFLRSPLPSSAGSLHTRPMQWLIAHHSLSQPRNTTRYCHLTLAMLFFLARFLGQFLDVYSHGLQNPTLADSGNGLY